MRIKYPIVRKREKGNEVQYKNCILAETCSLSQTASSVKAQSLLFVRRRSDYGRFFLHSPWTTENSVILSEKTKACS